MHNGKLPQSPAIRELARAAFACAKALAAGRPDPVSWKEVTRSLGLDAGKVRAVLKELKNSGAISTPFTDGNDTTFIVIQDSLDP